MNIRLTPEMEQLVAEKVKMGPYRTPDDVIGEGLRLLSERDRLAESFVRDLRAGFEEIELGECTEYGDEGVEELSKRLKERGRTRLDEEDLKTKTR